jgi:hypothetical protein
VQNLDLLSDRPCIIIPKGIHESSDSNNGDTIKDTNDFWQDAVESCDRLQNGDIGRPNSFSLSPWL